MVPFFVWYVHGDEVFDATINDFFFLWTICEFLLPAMHKQSNQARCMIFPAITETEKPPPNIPTEKRQPPSFGLLPV